MVRGEGPMGRSMQSLSSMTAEADPFDRMMVPEREAARLHIDDMSWEAGAAVKVMQHETFLLSIPLFEPCNKTKLFGLSVMERCDVQAPPLESSSGSSAITIPFLEPLNLLDGWIGFLGSAGASWTV